MAVFSTCLPRQTCSWRGTSAAGALALVVAAAAGSGDGGRVPGAGAVTEAAGGAEGAAGVGVVGATGACMGVAGAEEAVDAAGVPASAAAGADEEAESVPEEAAACRWAGPFFIRFKETSKWRAALGGILPSLGGLAP